MKAVIQRVLSASVAVGGEIHSQIGKGLVILLGVEKGDTKNDARFLAEKCVRLRVFEDENRKMNLAVSDVGGEMLVVSQFTLLADCSHGNRPGFADAARPSEAEPLYRAFARLAGFSGVDVKTGVFGADMAVSLVNDGPVTILLDTKQFINGRR